MAGFLRRKSKIQEREPPLPAEPNNGSVTTPIFARLATSLTSSAQQSGHARIPPQSRVVSQPMSLGSTGPHRAVTLNRTSGEGVNRPHSRRYDAHGTPPRQVTQVQTNVQTNPYPQSGAQQGPVPRTASAAGTMPQRQVARSLRRVPALQEKPLPIPVPADDDPPIATVQTNEQTSLTQPSLVSRLSHRFHPPQSSASPPSAYEARTQQPYKGRSVSVDSPRQIQENPVSDQFSNDPMAPPDSGPVVRQSLVTSYHLNQQPLVDDVHQPPRTDIHKGQRNPTSRSIRESVLAPKHTIEPSHQTGRQKVYANGVLNRAATADEHVAYSLRTDVSILESKLDRYGDSIPSSGQINSYRSVSTTHIHPNGLGSTISSNVTTVNLNLDRPLPSRPVADDQGSENGDVFVDAIEEIKETTPALGAGEASPEIMLHRDYFAKSLPSPSSSPDPNTPSIPEGQSPPVAQTPPLQVHKNLSVGQEGDNMGSSASFPDPQSPSPSKLGSRLKPASATEGHRMRNGYQNQDYYNHYQDLGSTPQVMHTFNHVRGKPLIFAAMEANIDQQQSSEEQKVSVRLWDGQDRPIGPNMGGYMAPLSPAPIPDHKRAVLADGASHVPVGYPSPPSSELSYPRAGKVDASQVSPHKFSNTGSPTKSRKLSKTRPFSVDGRHVPRPGTPVRTRPLTPVSPASSRKSIAGNGLSTPVQLQVSLQNEEPQLLVPSSRQGRNSGMALLDVGEDPFAKAEGVRMLAPSLAAHEKDQEKDKEPRRTKANNAEISHELFEDESVRLRKRSNGSDGASLINHVKPDAKSERGIGRDEGRISRSKELEAKKKNDVETTTSTASLEQRPKSRDKSEIISHRLSYRPSRRKGGESSFHLAEFLCDERLLGELLSYLSFYEWCILASVSKGTRTKLVETTALKEVVLERFLRTVGYVKWCWDGPDPLPLSLQDLNDYMFGVSTPTHEYARVADLYVKSLSLHPTQRDPSLFAMARRLTAATRSYSRIVLRLRAHAENDAASRTFSSVPGRTGYSRPPSRASSPHSAFSHGHSQHGNGQPNLTPGTGFRSPLFRPKRAPLLRVFVPSPDGDWLSDKSVLECEAECRRAGIMDLIRFGDVVWDTAVGDEGNVGKLVWDGSYLIDLDYSYSPIGDLPKYIPALAFPPSYFHKVIRTGPHSGNPIVHIELSQWGEQVATNLQLLQDRVRTETPQGAFHNVVRWVRRSSFVIRPPTKTHVSPQGVLSPRIPIPDTRGLFVDPGWYGTVIVETEGTNESLADLQDRCGPGAFPPRAKGVAGQMGINPEADARRVFRILRERSRPGEIWVKAVSVKEKILI